MDRSTDVSDVTHVEPNEAVETASLRLPGQREQMRQFSVISSLDLLRRRLLAL